MVNTLVGGFYKGDLVHIINRESTPKYADQFEVESTPSSVEDTWHGGLRRLDRGTKSDNIYENPFHLGNANRPS